MELVNNKNLAKFSESIVRLKHYAGVLKSEKVQLREDWFWHQETLEMLKTIHDQLVVELHKDAQYFESGNMKFHLQDALEVLDTLFVGFKQFEETKKFDDHFQYRMNEYLRTLADKITTMVSELELFEKEHLKKKYSDKERELFKSGFNYVRDVELIPLLIENWSIFEELKTLIGGFTVGRLGKTIYQEYRYAYVWTGLGYFKHLILKNLSKKEIEELKVEIRAELGLKPSDNAYANPDFSNNLGQFNQKMTLEKQLRTKLLHERNVKNLREVLIILALIRLEHFDEQDVLSLEHFSSLVMSNEILDSVFHLMVKYSDNHVRLAVRFLKLVNCYHRSSVNSEEVKLFFEFFIPYIGTDKPIRALSNTNFYEIKELIATAKRISKIDEILKSYQLRSVDEIFDLRQNNLSKRNMSLDKFNLILDFLELKVTDSLILSKLSPYDSWEISNKEFLLNLAKKTDHPDILFNVLFHLLKKQDIKSHPHIVDAIVKNIQEYESHISKFRDNQDLESEKNELYTRYVKEFDILFMYSVNYLHNLDNVDFFFKLGINDIDSFETLVSAMRVLRLDKISNIKDFWDKGGAELFEILKNKYSDKEESYALLNFCYNLVGELNSTNYEEVLRNLNASINLIDKAVGNSRQKTKLFSAINEGLVSKSIFRHFNSFLLYLLENKPNSFISVLEGITRLSLLDSNVTKQLLELAKILKSFKLFIDDHSLSHINSEDIENSFLFFSERLGKSPKKIEKNLFKFRKNLTKLTTQHKETAFNYINLSMSQLAIDYFTQIVHKEVSGYFEEFCGVSLPPKLVHDADVVNALTVAKKAVHSLGDLPKIFIRELCLENMVPFKKYPEAYPYNQEANIKFIKKVHEHHDLSAWINGYEKICGVLLTEEFEKQNKQMVLFYQEVIDDYQKLGIEIKHEEMFSKFKEVENHENKDAIADLRIHLKAIEDFERMLESHVPMKKVKLFIETNPLKILQMGNVVSGSCLSVHGGNSWTTITNAVDVNKAVLFAVNADKPSMIVGRRLVAITDDLKLVQYGVYNNFPRLDLDALFEHFLIDIARHCSLPLGESGTVSNLVAGAWYAGTAMERFDISLYEQIKNDPMSAIGMYQNDNLEPDYKSH